MDRLSRLLGGPRIWVKRDDCAGGPFGGNQVRKLEFLLGDALRKGATRLITHGSVQSNHARQTAAVAVKFGLKCTILLEHRLVTNDSTYLRNGNTLMEHLMGVVISHHRVGTDMDAAMEVVARASRDVGERPYVIPAGGSNAIGALGYANAAFELVTQANELGLEIDRIAHPTGSAGTQAGLLAGLAMINAKIPVLGIGVHRPKAAQEGAVYKLANATADLLDGPVVPRSDVEANCDYVGPASGISTEDTLEAISLCARTEAIFLDPAHSGKCKAGIIDLLRRGRFSSDANIVFLHTGGQVALFGHADQLNRAVA